ncbi:MAG: UDP-4-amino-4,6-dideoxy-N-acetyl-beta-L-altrosamine transaminase [Candidatus Melainabacteria bacterium]|nr:UDP-4-amino-4,6-dideoxy-N-acetyl-beta-L-altrosamine transaminase [Candidatus Melainabacteria bacterium]
MIPYGKQNINEADIQAVVDVLRSDFLTQGPAVPRFERNVAEYCGALYAVAVSNATAGLHIACLAAGLGPGDWLWTSPNTFVASSNCALCCGAQVDFVDIDPVSYLMSVESLERKLQATPPDKLPKIVVPVHFAGQSCDMVGIKELSRKYGFMIIEDAAHSIGGSYRESKIGSCQHSDMTVFSFHPVKVITTGEGGMVMTNNEELFQKLTRLRSHGITRDVEFLSTRDAGPFYYEQLELGFNYRMTDIQAALGSSQMHRLDEFVARRHELVGRYDELLSGLPVNLPFQHPDGYSAHHLYVVRLDLDRVGMSRRQVFDAMRDAGVLVNVHYIPVHTQPYYRRLGFDWGQFPEAEQYYREALTLPLYFDLRDQEQDRVVHALIASIQKS